MKLFSSSSPTLLILLFPPSVQTSERILCFASTQDQEPGRG